MKEIMNKIRNIFKLVPASSLHVDRPIEKTEIDRDSLIKDYELIVNRLNEIIKNKYVNTNNKEAEEQMFQQNNQGTFRGKTF